MIKQLDHGLARRVGISLRLTSLRISRSLRRSPTSSQPMGRSSASVFQNMNAVGSVLGADGRDSHLMWLEADELLDHPGR
jgi:hypothetical protein